jgi:hypothetical protein
MAVGVAAARASGADGTAWCDAHSLDAARLDTARLDTAGRRRTFEGACQARSAGPGVTAGEVL